MSPVTHAWLTLQSRNQLCQRWRSLPLFRSDVGERPSWRHLLIRDDVSREFSPDNARWQVAKWYRRRRQTNRRQ